MVLSYKQQLWAWLFVWLGLQTTLILSYAYILEFGGTAWIIIPMPLIPLGWTIRELIRTYKKKDYAFPEPEEYKPKPRTIEYPSNDKY